MIRRLACLCLACAACCAVEPDELPALDFAPLRPLPGERSTQPERDGEQTPSLPAKSGSATAPAPTAEPTEPETLPDEPRLPLSGQEPTDPSTPQREPVRSQPRSSGKVAAARRPDIPAPPTPDELLRRWTDRTIAPPRLAATLFERSAPAIRPLAADYRLKPGDLVRVVAWGGQPVNGRIPVAPNGDLAVPGFGLVPVGGLSAAEAQARVLELVRSHFKQGGAVIAVEQPAAQAVTVVGEVARPGYLVLPPGGTVLEALAAAGGVLPRGGLRAIRVAAGGAPSEIDLYRIALDGDATLLTPLPAGALVFVPLAGPQVQVFGAVRRMAGVEVKPGENLAEALRLAGGLAADADPAAVRLLREGAAGQELRQLPAEALAGLPASDGDRLFIAARRDLAGAAGAVAVRGAVRSPGAYPLAAGLTLDQALALAGGLLPQADAGAIRVRRLLPEAQLVIENGVPTPVHHATLVAPPGSTALAALDEIVVPERPKPDPQRSGVAVSGAVGKPGLYAFTPGMTVRDLILLAERPLPTAQVEHASLVRSRLSEQGARTAEHLDLDLRPILAGTDPGLALQPGDSLIVRTTADTRVRVVLSGQFHNTGTFTLPAGATLGQAIRLAGGVLPEAFPRGARIHRVQEAEAAQQFLDDLIRRTEVSLAVNRRAALDADDQEAKDDAARNLARQEAELAQLRRASATGRMAGVDIARILAGDAAADQVLQDGDRIELPARPGTVRILGEVMVPGSVVFVAGLSAKDLIKRSGGLTRQADAEAVFVVRADGSVVATAQGDTLAWDHERRRWARTSLSGLKLEEGDAVIIPADVRFKDSTRRITRDWTQIMFQIAATVGTIAVIGK